MVGRTRPEVVTEIDWRAASAEFIATLLFVFVGVGAVLVTGAMTGGKMDPSRLTAIALAHGLTIAVAVAVTAKISGGHINPAVTFGAFVAGRIGLRRAASFIVAQVAGGIIGVLLIKVAVPSALQGNLGAHALGGDVNAGMGLIVEVVLTFLLVFTVFATAIDPRGFGNLAPVAIGLAVLVGHFIGVPLTGASMNPARSFGPALIAGEWANHWVYWAGPLIGGALAALVYEWVYIVRRE
ncbi:MAG: MIP family channel protein [Chloroflexi bacterium]|nr:MIP family channel protein [Chloroflexota bacterium]